MALWQLSHVWTEWEICQIQYDTHSELHFSLQTLKNWFLLFSTNFCWPGNGTKCRQTQSPTWNISSIPFVKWIIFSPVDSLSLSLSLSLCLYASVCAILHIHTLHSPNSNSRSNFTKCQNPSIGYAIHLSRVKFAEASLWYHVTCVFVIWDSRCSRPGNTGADSGFSDGLFRLPDCQNAHIKWRFRWPLRVSLSPQPC